MKINAINPNFIYALPFASSVDLLDILPYLYMIIINNNLPGTRQRMIRRTPTDYISSVLSYGCIPYITRPTRITEYTATLIDHIFLRLPVRKMKTPVNSGVLFNDITDHLPVFLLPHDENQNRKREIGRPKKTRIFSESNIQKFVDIIFSTNWCEIMNHESGDLNCTLFYEHMSRFYSESFPLVTISQKRQKTDHGWHRP